MFKLVNTILLVFMFSFGFLLLLPSPVEAQFSGSNICNYTCPELPGALPFRQSATAAACPDSPESVNVIEKDGDFLCSYVQDGQLKTIKASPKPPTIQQLEIWFVRILYAIWAVSGIVFTLILISIGFQYMTSFGNVVAQGEAIKRLQRWIIGLILVFLSYPILNTVFNLLPINDTNTCISQLVDSMPGFKFVFPEVCN